MHKYFKLRFPEYFKIHVACSVIMRVFVLFWVHCRMYCYVDNEVIFRRIQVNIDICMSLFWSSCIKFVVVRFLGIIFLKSGSCSLDIQLLDIRYWYYFKIKYRKSENIFLLWKLYLLYTFYYYTLINMLLILIVFNFGF